MQYARKQYLNQLIRKKDNGRVKIISGLRRSGKSYLLFTLYHQYLMHNAVGEDQIIGLALDEIDMDTISGVNGVFKRPCRRQHSVMA